MIQVFECEHRQLHEYPSMISTKTATNATTIVPKMTKYHTLCPAQSFVVEVLCAFGSTPLVMSNIICFDFQPNIVGPPYTPSSPNAPEIARMRSKSHSIR